MRKIFNFQQFINESTAAGNMDNTYSIPFKYSSHDPKEGYNSRTFLDDLNSIFVEKPELKKEIIEFISSSMGIISLEELAKKPFSYISEIIPEIERIIEAGEYEPEIRMPGGATLFIRNKEIKNGKNADFYLNSHGTKIEVVTEDEDGNEKVYRFSSDKFPFDRFNFTDQEKEETANLIDKLNSNP
jgi:hypothetical protein